MSDSLKAVTELSPEDHADPDMPSKLDPCVAKAKVREVAKKLKKSSNPMSDDGMGMDCMTSLGTYVPHEFEDSAGKMSAVTMNSLLCVTTGTDLRGTSSLVTYIEDGEECSNSS